MKAHRNSRKQVHYDGTEHYYDRENTNVDVNGYTLNGYGYESENDYKNDGLYGENGDCCESYECNGENQNENISSSDINDKVKNVFFKSYSKRTKIAKRTIISVFSIVGFVLVVLGIILGKTIEQELYILCAVGGVYLVLGIILFFAIPNKIDYEKIKKRVNKYGYDNFYVLSAKIEEFSAKIGELEIANQKLNEKVNELENIVESLRNSRKIKED